MSHRLGDVAVVGGLPEAVLRPVRDGSAFEATVEQLATAVRLGVFAHGERLPPERELADRLGVSRSTLREAISALRLAGLVETTRGRRGGTVVTYHGVPADPGGAPALRLRGDELRDALDFRRVVEPGAAELAARRGLSGDQRAWLTTRLDEVERAPDEVSHRLADSRLHLALASASASPRLVAAVIDAQGALREMLGAIPMLAPNIGHSNRAHRRVVGAVLQGRPAVAREAMTRHCDDTSALLRGLLG